MEFLKSFWDENFSYYTLAEFEGRHLTKMNLSKNQSIIKNHIEPWFSENYPHLLLRKTDEKKLKEFITSLYSKKCLYKDCNLSTGFIKKIKTCITVPLKWAQQNNLYSPSLNINLSMPLMRYKEVVHRGILNDSEEKVLLSYQWKNQKAYWGFKIAIICGLRLGEIRALRFCDVTKEFIKVRRAYNDIDKIKSTKTGTVRFVPCPEEFYNYFEKQRIKMNAKYTDFIFCCKSDGTVPVDENYFTRNFYKVMKELGIERVRYNPENDKIETVCFHSLRHQTATRWVSCGEDVRIVAKALGHSTAMLQQRYANHFDEKMMKRFRNKLIEKGSLNLL